MQPKLRTVVLHDEELYAYHKVEDGVRKSIVVTEDGEEVNIVFPEYEQIDRPFDYFDWLELPYYRKDEE